jgi:hypothetical protein
MSAVCKLSSKMPGDAEINGLDSLVPQMLDAPEALVVAVVYLDVQKVTDDIDGGTRVPTVRVRRIEPLGGLEDVPDTVKKAVATAEQKRTGRKAIPFDIVEVGEHAFGDTLPDEG